MVDGMVTYLVSIYIPLMILNNNAPNQKMKGTWFQMFQPTSDLIIANFGLGDSAKIVTN
jgi:hypothetical protein